MKKRLIQLKRLYRAFGLSGMKLFFQLHWGSSEHISIQFPDLPQPIYLRRKGSDYVVFEDIFLKHEYHFKHTSQPEFILDAGANIGLAAVFFKRKFPQVRLLCIEPEPSNFEMLKKNTAHYSGIECLQKGLWYKTCALQILDDGLGEWGFTVKEAKETDPNTVQAVSIPDLIQSYNIKHIDVLKMDIEGSEIEVLQNNHEAWIPHTGTLLIELHDRLRKDCSRNVFKTLVQYPFSLDHVGENNIVHFHKS
ncbi:MAG: hypothetical protein RL582_857 [Bacteroidota bacterium]|jgi:FkbM family methyltransferase